MTKQYAWDVTSSDEIEAIGAMPYGMTAADLVASNPAFELVSNAADQVPILVHRQVPITAVVETWGASIIGGGVKVPYEFIGPRPPHR